MRHLQSAMTLWISRFGTALLRNNGVVSRHIGTFNAYLVVKRAGRFASAVKRGNQFENSAVTIPPFGSQRAG